MKPIEIVRTVTAIIAIAGSVFILAMAYRSHKEIDKASQRVDSTIIVIDASIDIDSIIVK